MDEQPSNQLQMIRPPCSGLASQDTWYLPKKLSLIQLARTESLALFIPKSRLCPSQLVSENTPNTAIIFLSIHWQQSFCFFGPPHHSIQFPSPPHPSIEHASSCSHIPCIHHVQSHALCSSKHTVFYYISKTQCSVSMIHHTPYTNRTHSSPRTHPTLLSPPPTHPFHGLLHVQMNASPSGRTPTIGVSHIDSIQTHCVNQISSRIEIWIYAASNLEPQ